MLTRWWLKLRLAAARLWALWLGIPSEAWPAHRKVHLHPDGSVEVRREWITHCVDQDLPRWAACRLD